MLCTICKLIHDEFITPGSLNEINVSFECRHRLGFLLETKDNINKFNSFYDFAVVFDEALVQIYKLILSMYSYRFVGYVTDIQNE